MFDSIDPTAYLFTVNPTVSMQHRALTNSIEKSEGYYCSSVTAHYK